MKQVLPRRIDDAEQQPDRPAVAAEGGPGDRGVQRHVGQLVQDLVEPAAERRAGALQPGEPAVGRVEHQGQRQRQRDGHAADPAAEHRRRSIAAAESIKARRARVRALGRTEVGQSRSASRSRQGKCPVLSERLIGQAPRQLFVGGRQRFRPVEPPEHGGFRRSPSTQAAPQPAGVVEAIGPQDRGIRPRRPADEHDAAPA